MAVEHHYQNAIGATTTFDTTISGKIRLGELGVTEEAQMAQAGVGQLMIDDDNGDQDFVSHQRWYVKETAGRSQATLTGTVSKTAASQAITGSSTLFTSELQAGDEIKVPGGGGTEYLIVQTITDDTHLSVYISAVYSASGQTAVRAPQQRLITGFTGDQHVGRFGGRSDGGAYIGAARDWQLDIVDQNSILHTRIFTGSDANRPAETVDARMAWFLGASEITDIGVVDEGLVASSSTAMDKTDYRGRFVDEVLNDMGQVSGYNFGLEYHEITGNYRLWFAKFTTFRYPSALMFSNDETDILAGAFPYSPASELERTGQVIASQEVIPYHRTYLTRTRPATEAIYGKIDQLSPTSTIKTAAKAQAYGDRILADSADQDEVLHLTGIRMAAADVCRAKPYQQVQARNVAAPGWTTSRWGRIVKRDLREAMNGGRPVPGFYDVDLDLTPARPANLAIRAMATERHQDELDLLTIPGELLLYAATWRQLLTTPQPPADGETWTLIGEGPFVDDHDSPDPCMVTYYATVATIAQTVHTKSNATGGSSNGTIVHSVMYAIPGLTVSDLQVAVSGPNAPATDFPIGSLGNVALAFGAWGDGWDGFFVDPTGVETATLDSGWVLDFHSSRDYDATTDAAFVAGFPNTVYAHLVNGAAASAHIGMVNSAGTSMHWGGVAVYVPA